MPESKYSQYIITEPKKDFWGDPNDQKDGPDTMTSIAYLDNKIIKDAFYVECCWFKKTTRFSPPPHIHDFDEVLAFMGTDPENPRDLGGEIEIWLNGEQHILTRSCLVYIPRGMTHSPLHVRKLERPIFHFSAGNSGNYFKDLKK